MAPSYRQGVRVLVASFLAVGLAGCTFDENELHGVVKPTPADAGGADAPVVVPVDAEVVDSRSFPDGGPTMVGPVDAPALDRGSSDTGGDYPSLANLDEGGLDVPRIDAAAVDANDAPLSGIDAAIDVTAVDTPAVDVPATEAGRLDGSRG